MATTYQLISSVTVGSGGASSISFSSIPATYTDLCLMVSARSANASGNWDGVYIAFNGTSTTTNHTTRRLYGYGGAYVASDSSLPYGPISPNANTTASTFGNASIYIPNYAGSTNKSVSVDAVTENNSVNAIDFLAAGLWSNTAAITSITLTTESASNFAQYSSAYLYGIKNS